MSGMMRRYRKQAEWLRENGYDPSPRDHESMVCACGYEGTPELVLRFSEVDETPDDNDLFVCPECGDA